MFAVGLAGIGVLSLLSGDFALNWQPVPPWVPWREILARTSGVMLLAGGVGMLLQPTAVVSALLVMVNMMMWLLLLRLPRVVTSPASSGMWLGFGETVLLVCGGWILLASLAEDGRAPAMRRIAGDDGVRVARFLVAVALPVIGQAHFVSAEATAQLVPAWLPARLGLAYFTGACHVAAGLCMLLTIVPRLAATLEAVMIGLFTLLVWVPRLIQAPASRFEWTATLISLAMTGAASAVAESFHSVRWRQAPWMRAA
jgi:uncharacterized membrane protein